MPELRQLSKNASKIPEKEQALPFVAPAQRLNADVLQLIVMEAISTCLYSHHNMAMICSGVCRAWRKATLNTPRAWSTISLIHGKRGVEYFNFSLTRASNVPLSIKLLGNPPYLTLVDLLTVISGQSNRIESLELEIPRVRDASIPSLPILANFPATRYLAIRHYRGTPSNISQIFKELFGSREIFSNLTELSLAYVSIQADELRSLFRPLRRLELDFCTVSNLNKANFRHLQELRCRNVTLDPRISPLWYFPELTLLRYATDRTIDTVIAPKINAPKLVTLKYDSRLRLELVGGTPHLHDLHVIYEFEEGYRNPIWSRSSVTSMAVYPICRDDFKGLVETLNNLPPSLKSLSFPRLPGDKSLDRDLFHLLKYALKRKSIVVTLPWDYFSND